MLRGCVWGVCEWVWGGVGGCACACGVRQEFVISRLGRHQASPSRPSPRSPLAGRLPRCAGLQSLGRPLVCAPTPAPAPSPTPAPALLTRAALVAGPRGYCHPTLVSSATIQAIPQRPPLPPLPLVGPPSGRCHDAVMSRCHRVWPHAPHDQPGKGPEGEWDGLQLPAPSGRRSTDAAANRRSPRNGPAHNPARLSPWSPSPTTTASTTQKSPRTSSRPSSSEGDSWGEVTAG